MLGSYSSPLANRRSIAANPAGVLVSVFFTFAVVFSGLLVVVMPPLVVLVVVLLPGLALAGILWPELLLAAMLLIAVGFVPESLLPGLEGGGAIRAEDLLLASLLGVLAFRALIRFKAGAAPERAIAAPLAALLGVMALSVIYAAAFRGVEVRAALGEFRNYLYLLPLVFIPMLLDSDAALGRLWRMIVVVMLVLASGQVVQALFNIPVLHGGRLETAVTLDKTYADATRSTVPGIYLLVFGLLYSLVRVFGAGERLLPRLLRWMPAMGLFAVAIMLTYGRAIWLVSAMGLFMVGLSLGTRRMALLVVLGSIVAVVGVSALAFLKPAVIQAVVDRATSVGAEVEGGSSLNWRFLENGYAWQKIKTSPLVGIGLGGSYKPIVGGMNDWQGQVRFIHNGYLYLLLKTGLIGFVIFAVFWARLVRMGWTLRHQKDGQLRRLGNCFFVLTLLPLATAAVRPEWASHETLVVFATLGGFLTAYARRAGQGNKDAASEKRQPPRLARPHPQSL